jgi:hypothetical protein
MPCPPALPEPKNARLLPLSAGLCGNVVKRPLAPGMAAPLAATVVIVRAGPGVAPV